MTEESSKHPMRCYLMEICKFASWSKDLRDPNSVWYCSTPDCRYRNGAPEHDAAIREDERKIIESRLNDAKYSNDGRDYVYMQNIDWIFESRRSEIPTTNDHDYQCGDNCHGECSGEYDGKIHCPETELEKRGGE